MLGRHAGEPQRCHGGFLPPVAFPNVACSVSSKEPPNPDGREPHERRIAANESLHRRSIQVIVMVVRVNDGIDRWKRVEVDRGRNATTRAGKLYGRCASAPDGVEKEIQPADLEQKAGVTDPGDGGQRGFRAWKHERGCRHRKGAGLRPCGCRSPRSIDERPLQEIKEPVSARSAPRISESTTWLVVRGKLWQRGASS